MTVVFDAGQNSDANFALLAGTGLRYVGSVPASDCRDLLALPAAARSVADESRFGGLTACDTRRAVYGTERRVILTHSPELHARQARGFHGTTLAKAGRKLDELAATLARGKTRRPAPRSRPRSGNHARPLGAARHRLAAGRRAAQGPAPELGHRPGRPRSPGRGDLRQARADHRSPRLARRRGDRHYRSQSEAEFSFRQMKDTRVVSFSPMFHWTEHNIRVHAFTCVLALQIAHLLRLQAERAGLHMSVRELLTQLPASPRPS